VYPGPYIASHPHHPQNCPPVQVVAPGVNWVSHFAPNHPELHLQVFGDVQVPFPHPPVQIGEHVDLWVLSVMQEYPASIVQVDEQPSPFTVFPSSQGSHSVRLFPQYGPGAGQVAVVS